MILVSAHLLPESTCWKKIYEDSFVLQSLKFKIKASTIQTTLLSGNVIIPWFELDTVDETSIDPYNLIRLSRISDIILL